VTRIAPSILSADFMRLGDEIRAAEEAGAELVHVDVMDGHFVPNITIGPMFVEGIRKITKLPIDVHLMISDPDKYAHDFASAGSDYITVHAEATMHLHRSVQCIKEEGVKAGVSLNPATPLCSLDYILSDIELVLIMSVNPGFGGQKFIPSALEKIRKLKDTITERNFSVLIEVDGGVKIENAAKITRAGADILVMGSAFFGSGDYSAFIKKLREELGK
jgi:ribulose-phosphate 3-epimerase